jgi:beta-N-acetylhexosaminidase
MHRVMSVGLVALLVVLLFTECGSSRPGRAESSTVPSTAKPATTTSTPATAPSCSNASTLSSWSVARRAAQLEVVPVEEDDISTITPSVQAGVGGIILYGSVAPEDLSSQLKAVEAQAPGNLQPLVMTDEEGGEVQRMANLAGILPWPREMAESMTTSQVSQLATVTAQKMRAAGVTMDLAPVLDIASGPGPDALHTDGPRSFGPNATTVTNFGLAFAEGLQSGGVIPVVKHFPGEGAASANTDDAEASTPPYSALEGSDLLPFQAAVKAGLPAVMVGNATIPGLSTVPASLSSTVISGLLRGQYGFNGLVMTDSLSADAIADRGIGVPIWFCSTRLIQTQ